MLELLVVNDLRYQEQAFFLDGHYLLIPSLDCPEFLSLKYDRRASLKRKSTVVVDDDEKAVRRESTIY